MDLPLRYRIRVDLCADSGKFVCHLNKSIYGLKQTSQQWYSKFSQAPIGYGFVHLKFDDTFFSPNEFIHLLLHFWFMWMISTLLVLLNPQLIP